MAKSSHLSVCWIFHQKTSFANPLAKPPHSSSGWIHRQNSIPEVYWGSGLRQGSHYIIYICTLCTYIYIYRTDSYRVNLLPIGSMYGIYANIGGILMVNVTIYSIHGSYGLLIIQPCPKIWKCLHGDLPGPPSGAASSIKIQIPRG